VIMTYRIGQTYPLDRPRGIQGGQRIPPTWYCLLTPPMKERAAREHLRAQGVYAFYPSREKRWTVAGRTHRQEFPEVSGYVFALFKYEPQWDIMKEKRRLISGVMGVNGYPTKFPRDVIRHMQGLTVEAKRLEEAKRELMRVRAGDKAKITQGPLSGFVVDVYQVNGDEAVAESAELGKVRASLSGLERIIDL